MNLQTSGKQQDEIFKTVLDNVSDGVTVIDKDLRTPNFIMGGEPDTLYHSKIQQIHTPARLFVFSDGVFDITKSDGSIWGFNQFAEFMTLSFSENRSGLDSLLSYTQALSQKATFEDDFSILEIVFN